MLTKSPEEEEGEEKHAIEKITLSEGVTKPFWEFDGGRPEDEDFIDLINCHKDLLHDLRLKENFKGMELVKEG